MSSINLVKKRVPKSIQMKRVKTRTIQAAVGYVRRLSTSKKIEKLKIFKNSDGDFATVEDLNDILAHKRLTCHVSLITYYLKNDMLYCFYGPTFFSIGHRRLLVSFVNLCRK